MVSARSASRSTLRADLVDADTLIAAHIAGGIEDGALSLALLHERNAHRAATDEDILAGHFMFGDDFG